MTAKKKITLVKGRQRLTDGVCWLTAEIWKEGVEVDHVTVWLGGVLN